MAGRMARDHMARRKQGSHGRGPSQRQLRVGEAVRHELSALIERDVIRDPALAGVPITVTEVSMSPDLKVASAYVTPFGNETGADPGEIVAALNRVAPALRRMLGPRTNLKFLPELRFRLDTSFDQAGRIEDLLRAVSGTGENGDGGDGP